MGALAGFNAEERDRNRFGAAGADHRPAIGLAPWGESLPERSTAGNRRGLLEVRQVALWRAKVKPSGTAAENHDLHADFNGAKYYIHAGLPHTVWFLERVQPLIDH